MQYEKIRSIFRPALLSAVFVALLGAFSGAVAAQNLPPIEEEEYITQELLAAAIGNLIRRNCDSISARTFRVIGRAKKLRDYALGLGYSEDEIRAYLESREEIRRFREMAWDYLISRGASKDDPESICRVGRQEIAGNTPAGQLLRSWK